MRSKVIYDALNFGKPRAGQEPDKYGGRNEQDIFSVVDFAVRGGTLSRTVESREEVDRLCEEARQEGALKMGPYDSGYPVGYWAFISDPDGHTLEVSHGQEVALAVAMDQA